MGIICSDKNLISDTTKAPVFALEILTKIKENFPKPLADYWGADVVFDTILWFDKAQNRALNSGAEYISVYFNIDESFEIEESVKLFIELQKKSKMPMIIRGSGQKDLDNNLIPRLVKEIKKPAIIAFAQDLNYVTIVNSILESEYKDDIRLVLRAPIDITLTKELNVLCMDLGIKPQNIIMDTDTGCVGMGLDYGYSIIERLCIARAEGDKVLNPPVIVFSGEESFKSKESKSDDFKDTRGSLDVRAYSVEIATTMALISAGADIAVVWNPKTIETIAPLYLKQIKETECLK